MVVARVAAAQHGVVARRQLLTRGLSPKQIHGRTRRGLLVPIHRGVYAVGHSVLRPEGWWLAAVLAAGPDAVLAGRSAAAHWLLRPASPRRTVVVARGGHLHRTRG